MTLFFLTFTQDFSYTKNQLYQLLRSIWWYKGDCVQLANFDIVPPFSYLYAEGNIK